MATFEYSSVSTYTQRGSGEQYDYVSTQTTTGSLDAGDDVFTIGEVIPGAGTYIGYYTSGGEDYIVVDTGGALQIFGPAGAPPATENPFGLNQDLIAESIPVCFAAGTLISTPTGKTAVEALEIGDLVTTVDGNAVSVKWIGRQTVSRLFTPADRFAPVRVTAGALGDGLPHSDLVLTAEHALILDGYAINAGALVNGTTIRIEPHDSLPDRVTYYHVETEGHEVILANGAPAETFVDYVSRRAFDNHAEFVDLSGLGDDMLDGQLIMIRHGWNRIFHILSANGKHGQNQIIYGKRGFPDHPSKPGRLTHASGTIVRK